MTSYHDLHITTDQIPRTSIFNLPFGYFVICTRTAGWELWLRSGSQAKTPDTPDNYAERVVAGEYDDRGLRLDVDGVVIVDSLTAKAEADAT